MRILDHNDKRSVSLRRFVYALGIRHVGEETAELIANNFPKLLTTNLPAQAGYQLQTTDLESVEGVGPVVAEEVVKWFQDSHNKKILSNLLKYVKIENYKLQTTDYRLKNKTLVLTGTLETLSRDEAKAKIKSLGGKVASSVSSNTDYVVTGENPGSKYEDAQKLGVKIISEKEFLKLIS